MKNFKRFVAVALVAVMAMGFAGCGVKKIEEKDFKDVVKDIMDADKEDFSEYEGKETGVDYIETELYYRGEDSDKFTIRFEEYEDEEAAQYAFDETYYSIKFIKEHDGIDGKVKISKKYITFDAEIEPYYDADSQDTYGGIYISGPYIYTIECSTGKDKDKDVVDDLLKELGLPRPSRA